MRCPVLVVATIPRQGTVAEHHHHGGGQAVFINAICLRHFFDAFDVGDRLPVVGEVEPPSADDLDGRSHVGRYRESLMCPADRDSLQLGLKFLYPGDDLGLTVLIDELCPPPPHLLDGTGDMNYISERIVIKSLNIFLLMNAGISTPSGPHKFYAVVVLLLLALLWTLKENMIRRFSLDVCEKKKKSGRRSPWFRKRWAAAANKLPG
uniref:Uncharacterized protein n=1 Tax=Glossina pallidipes TaxID=7398 RepID=A0A1A9ZW97_GLOPL